MPFFVGATIEPRQQATSRHFLAAADILLCGGRGQKAGNRMAKRADIVLHALHHLATDSFTATGHATYDDGASDMTLKIKDDIYRLFLGDSYIYAPTFERREEQACKPS